MKPPILKFQTEFPFVSLRDEALLICSKVSRFGPFALTHKDRDALPFLGLCFRKIACNFCLLALLSHIDCGTTSRFHLVPTINMNTLPKLNRSVGLSRLGGSFILKCVDKNADPPSCTKTHTGVWPEYSLPGMQRRCVGNFPPTKGRKIMKGIATLNGRQYPKRTF